MTICWPTGFVVYSTTPFSSRGSISFLQRVLMATSYHQRNTVHYGSCVAKVSEQAKYRGANLPFHPIFRLEDVDCEGVRPQDPTAMRGTRD